jgi:hypothetical protein
VLLEPSEVPAIHPIDLWLSCHSEGQTTFASVLDDFFGQFPSHNFLLQSIRL